MAPQEQLNPDREQVVTEAFVWLATGLADGIDVVDMLSGLAETTTRLLDVASTGMLLADRQGELHVVAASSESIHTLDAFHRQHDQGPCLDAFRTGAPVSIADLGTAAHRWPVFVAAAADAGYVSVHAMPMRLRDNVLGALGLFGTSIGALGEDDLRLAQALAYVAAVALVQEKASEDTALVNARLQRALDSRVVLEQAKGVLAQRGRLSMDDAFAVLRRFARDHNLKLTDVARRVAARELASEDVLGHAGARAQQRR
jgi:GAF domain-containing protein